MTSAPQAPVLELANATLIRGGVRVLDRLSLVVSRGEHTTILGPNGAGKTSLMRMLMLEDRPLVADNGVPPLRMFGREHWDLTELRAHLGIVTGDLDATFGLGTSSGRVAGFDVALSGLFGSHGVFAHHAVGDDARAAAAAALQRVQASHLAAKPLNEMSTGERRRVLIARALITRPDALLLDEPTTGLDFVARHRFMESIRGLAREGTTVILITHHVDEIIPEMRRVVLLQEGKVAFSGSREDALTRERLSGVFGSALAVEKSGEYYHVRVT
jgi:iron complex transport system ATP-binding protein